MKTSLALALEAKAGHSESESKWWSACGARLIAVQEWQRVAEWLSPADASVYLEHAETNARALAANADRLADALSALRGRAG